MALVGGLPVIAAAWHLVRPCPPAGCLARAPAPPSLPHPLASRPPPAVCSNSVGGAAHASEVEAPFAAFAEPYSHPPRHLAGDKRSAILLAGHGFPGRPPTLPKRPPQKQPHVNGNSTSFPAVFACSDPLCDTPIHRNATRILANPTSAAGESNAAIDVHYTAIAVTGGEVHDLSILYFEAVTGKRSRGGGGADGEGAGG